MENTVIPPGTVVVGLDGSLGDFPAGFLATHHQNHAVDPCGQAEAVAAGIDGFAIDHHEAVARGEHAEQLGNLLVQQMPAMPMGNAQWQQIERQVGVRVHALVQQPRHIVAGQQIKQSGRSVELVQGGQSAG